MNRPKGTPWGASCPCCSRDGHLENDMSTYMRPLDTPLFLYTAAHTRIEFLWILFSCAIRGPRHESINWWEMVVGCTHRRLSKGPASKAVRGLWLLVGVVSQVSKWSAFSTDNRLTLRKKRRGRKHNEKNYLGSEAVIQSYSNLGPFKHKRINVIAYCLFGYKFPRFTFFH